MKHFITLSILLLSTFCFSQNSGLITGKVMDEEIENTPLVLANISIKGTAIKSTTDLTGMFVIEDLKDGEYTLVCSFVGYESKEVLVKIESGATADVKLSLAASRISLSELASLKKDEKTVSLLN